MKDDPFEEITRFFRQYNFLPSKLPIVILGILILILVFTSWFTIGPEEVGVVLLFGKYARTVQPGLNFKIPFGVEKVQKVPVQRQLKEEFGFRTVKAGVVTQYSPPDSKSSENPLVSPTWR